ncbi:unnamed protein product [Rotaria sordida]|uniref:RBR-type E3 ubiquitin transferase n=1 Tax=Rotaria sordida TaxID=392033 RepID=A0A815WNB8_9BILA|nr:unnamed protein product [Rotaria sordida]CAF1545638.1 unnamed protein product [Rotaria sordida]
MALNAFKLCCPYDKCNVECLIRDIVSILGFQQANRLALIAFKIYIRCPQNDLVQCFGNDCDQVYRPSTYSSTYLCDQCMKIYCIPCKAEYHFGITCEQFQQLEKERKEKALLEKNLGKLPFKKCPKCQTLIEKFAGCNAMKCTQCTIAFCWQCLFTDDNDVHYHFNDEKSSCYNHCFDVDIK